MIQVNRYLFVCFAIALSCADEAAASEVCTSRDGGYTQLSICGAQPFHSTEAEVTEARLIAVPESTVLLILWNETVSGGETVPYYGISLDGQQVTWVRETSYELRLKYARFDPLTESALVDPILAADPLNELYIVQFVTQPLDVFRDGLADCGATIYSFIPNHAYIVRMGEPVKASVEALPYVRSVSTYHPAFRVEPFLRENLAHLDEVIAVPRYNIVVFQRGLPQKTSLASRIAAVGGTVDVLTPGGFSLQATLTPEQLVSIAHSNEVAYINRWGDVVLDMDVARALGGANYVETVAGYTGQGVTGEVMDDNILETHQAFRGQCAGGAIPGAPCSSDSECLAGGTCVGKVILHGPRDPNGSRRHGTNVSGIVFGDGTGALPEHPPLPAARGMLPDGQQVFASSCRLQENSMSLTCFVQQHIPEEEKVDRYCHTCELVCSNCPSECEGVCGEEHVYEGVPYHAVFQTNSWGNDPTVDYTPDSHDLILYVAPVVNSL